MASISPRPQWVQWDMTHAFSLGWSHIWLFLAQCGIPAGFIKTMQAEEMENYKKYINILWGKPKSGERKKSTFQRNTYRLYIWKLVRKSNAR